MELYAPAILTYGYICKKFESRDFNGYLYTHVLSSITHNTQKEEATQCPLKVNK